MCKVLTCRTTHDNIEWVLVSNVIMSEILSWLGFHGAKTGLYVEYQYWSWSYVSTPPFLA